MRADGTIMLPVGVRTPTFPNATDAMRLVPWDEFVRTRPKLAETPDSGWHVYEVDYAMLTG